MIQSKVTADTGKEHRQAFLRNCAAGEGREMAKFCACVGGVTRKGKSFGDYTTAYFALMGTRQLKSRSCWMERDQSPCPLVGDDTGLNQGDKTLG